MRGATLFAVLAGFSCGQSADSSARFEVATVRMYPPGATVAPGVQGRQRSPDGVRLTHVTLRGCLQAAYQVPYVEGPDWITNESYDIVAKAAGPVSEAELQQMMRTLLSERFQLKVRRETNLSPVGLLTVSKGGVKNLHPKEQAEQPQIRREDGKLYMKNVTLERVAAVMMSPLGNMPIEEVRNQTGIEGQYDLTLDFKDFDPKDPQFREYREMRDALFDFASRALEKGYGLKLEKRNLPVEFLVVEDGNKVPTGN